MFLWQGDFLPELGVNYEVGNLGASRRLSYFIFIHGTSYSQSPFSSFSHFTLPNTRGKAGNMAFLCLADKTRNTSWQATTRFLPAKVLPVPQTPCGSWHELPSCQWRCWFKHSYSSPLCHRQEPQSPHLIVYLVSLNQPDPRQHPLADASSRLDSPTPEEPQCQDSFFTPPTATDLERAICSVVYRNQYWSWQSELSFPLASSTAVLGQPLFHCGREKPSWNSFRRGWIFVNISNPLSRNQLGQAHQDGVPGVQERRGEDYHHEMVSPGHCLFLYLFSGTLPKTSRFSSPPYLLKQSGSELCCKSLQTICQSHHFNRGKIKGSVTLKAGRAPIIRA